MSVLFQEIPARVLLDGIREGDALSFEVFYRMERNNLVHFVYSYTKEIEIAQDIAQESLLKVWEHRKWLDPEGNLRAFVFTVARNKTVDYLRKRVRTLSIDDPAVELLRCIEDDSVDELIDSLYLKKLIDTTFYSLPQKVRDTFIKSRAGGMKNREIADDEGVSVKTVEHRITVALKALKKIFDFC